MNPMRGVRGWLCFATAICWATCFLRFDARGQNEKLSTERSYDELAREALLTRAREISVALSASGFIPTESATKAEVILEGQSTHPSGAVALSACRYEFRNGLVYAIRRTDLFEDKGPASLILRHLTNEVLTLTPDSAKDRALELMRLLSYDPACVRASHKLADADDLMDAYPIRNGGPDFPKDLRFFGELISRKKIKITVSIAAQVPASAKATVFSPGTRISFLATSGELLEAWWLPNRELADLLSIPGPAPITISETRDFAPPVFVRVSRSIPGTVSNVTDETARQLVADLWAELKSNAGSNAQLKSVLVCDNLNQPTAVAQTMNQLCGDLAWTGISHAFRMDLPFDVSKIEQLAQNKRGIALLGVGGAIDLQLELIPDLSLEDNFIGGEAVGSDETQQHFIAIRDKFSPRIGPVLGRLALSNGLPDHVLFLFQPVANFVSSVVDSEFQQQLRGRAQVVLLMGVAESWSVGGGTTYFGGRPCSNAIALVHLSGRLPLQPDHLAATRLALARLSNAPPGGNLRALQARSPARIVSGEVIQPVRTLAYSFGPHPLEDVLAVFGEKWVHFLQAAQRVEVFRVSQPRQPRIQFDQTVEVLTNTGPKTVEGYSLLRTGNTLDAASARDLAAAILSEKNGHLFSNCVFDPGVIFQIWNGDDYARLVVCFTCSELDLTFYDSKGKPLRHVFSHFANRSELLKLALRGLPGDQDLLTLAFSI